MIFQFLPTHWWWPSAWRTWASYMHWRLETYGVYYPGGKFNGPAFFSLLKQFPSYRRWISEMDHQRGLPYKTH